MVKNKKRMSRNDRVDSKENEQTTDFVMGFYGVLEALKEKRGNKVFIQEDVTGRRFDEVKQMATKMKVPVQWVPKSKLDKLTDHGVHQGVVLGVTPYEYLSLEELIEQTKKTEPCYFIL